MTRSPAVPGGTLVLDGAGLAEAVLRDRTVTGRPALARADDLRVIISVATLAEVVDPRINRPALEWTLSRLVVEPIARQAAALPADAGLRGHECAIGAMLSATALGVSLVTSSNTSPCGPAIAGGAESRSPGSLLGSNAATCTFAVRNDRCPIGVSDTVRSYVPHCQTPFQNRGPLGHMDSLAATALPDIWDRLTGTQPDPGLWVVFATSVAALAVVVPHTLWRISRNAITIAHEGGHGLIALLTGRQLTGIRLHSDTSGLTVSRGKPYGLGMILTAAAGYTAPSLLGLGGAALLAAGHITLLLWVATALLVVMLVMIRNAYGVLTVVLAGGAFLLVSWLTGPQVQAAFAYAVVWFLLLGGVRPPFELQMKRTRGGAGDSDADQLSRLTHVPAGLWLFLFHAVSLCSLIGGGRWLLKV